MNRQTGHPSWPLAGIARMARSRRGWFALLAGTLLLMGGVVHAATCRVTESGGTGTDGSNWTSQAMALRSALQDATCDEIWVAAGFYTPTTTADRTISFRIERELRLYGGFSGTEATLAERVLDPANPSILSGDIDGNDTDADGNRIAETPDDIQGGNSYHVVVVDGTTGAGGIDTGTVLDGFVITAGSASGTPPDDFGGGLYCNGGGSGHACSPTLANLVFSGNSADNTGGAMYNNGSNGGTSSPVLNAITFSGNSAGIAGGAMANGGWNGGTSSPVLNNVTFGSNKSAQDGGAMANDGWNAGTSKPVLNHVTFSGNRADNTGGAMINTGSLDGDVSPELNNVVLWANSAAGGGPEIHNMNPATPVISHSIVQGSGGSGDSWDGALGVDGGGNLDADPLLGSLADNGGFTQTLLPAAGSAVIDAGSCALAEDQRGVARPQGAGCDIGAAEVALTALDVSVSGMGRVDAGATPLPYSGAIADCTESGGDCSASFAPDEVVTLTATPASGWHFTGWGGDCSGTANPTTVTLDGDRSCTASFAIGQYTVTPVVTGGNGSFSPDTAQLVDSGSTTTFEVIPDPGWAIDSVSGCGGALVGSTYTTAPITADCTVQADFAIRMVPVTTVISDGSGSIDPPGADVPYGDMQAFVITPDSGHVIDAVTGCGGTLVGNVYTTAPITEPCSVTVAFGAEAPVATPHPVPADDWRGLLLLIGFMSLLGGVALRRH